MIESTLIINRPFALKQINGKPIYTEIIRPEERFKEIEKKGYDKKYYAGWYEDYKKSFKKSVKEIKINHDINLGKLKRIVITPNAKGYISTYFFEFIQVNNIPIYWINGNGIIESSFLPTNFIKPQLAIKQYEAISKGKGLEIAKYFVRLKLDSINKSNMIPELDKAKDINNVLSIEGNASREYFEKYKIGIHRLWQWSGRKGKSNRNNNATDPVNSLLNFGYSILAQRMSEVLLKRGFELSLGFLHVSETVGRYNWNRLSYDFIEPFRIWIDDSVKELVFNDEIKLKDFTFNENKSQMILKDKPLKIGINKFNDALEPLEYKALPIIRKVESLL